eukprot:CAMPEP_0184489718 /NCGR_PEP_ID=MMETSP0113_2-20130426/16199_1 /TAXON_ID=91329 /ORGANISM="Norrisiella sphaerica, Strain BC52" /LENGTH=228 /DNA_ID=CAMNT_0026873301 /DNA_START=128 /DNA_END=814 /DNA_ORIENTATION=-
MTTQEERKQHCERNDCKDDEIPSLGLIGGNLSQSMTEIRPEYQNVFARTDFVERDSESSDKKKNHFGTEKKRGGHCSTIVLPKVRKRLANNRSRNFSKPSLRYRSCTNLRVSTDSKVSTENSISSNNSALSAMERKSPNEEKSLNERKSLTENKKLHKSTSNLDIASFRSMRRRNMIKATGTQTNSAERYLGCRRGDFYSEGCTRIYKQYQERLRSGMRRVAKQTGNG